MAYGSERPMKDIAYGEQLGKCHSKRQLRLLQLPPRIIRRLGKILLTIYLAQCSSTVRIWRMKRFANELTLAKNRFLMRIRLLEEYMFVGGKIFGRIGMVILK
jgi:hypothetical protein